MGVYIGASTKIIDRATGEIIVGRVPAYSVVGARHASWQTFARWDTRAVVVLRGDCEAR